MPADRIVQPTRRDVMIGALGAGAVITLGGGRLRASEVKPGGLRVAHLSDMHVKPEAQNGEGYAKALDSLKQLNPAPDFIITGGDHVMDTLDCTPQRAAVQWDLYQKVLEQNAKLKVYPVLGNHDVFGWSRKQPLPDDTPGYGKAMALDRLGLKQTYYGFDAGGWRFLVLDNIARRGGGYYGELDAEQTEWLKAELQANKDRPVVVFSHIPIASLCAFFFYYGGGKTPKEFWKIGDNLMHRDAKPLIALLGAHNVKLCVSGHIHLLDHVKYMGVDFICDGAVSGSWWGGPFQECSEGYGVLDFYPDGTFEHRYVTYGWKAPK